MVGYSPWGRPWSRPWGRKELDTTERLYFIPVYLPGKFHAQRSLVGYIPWGCIELNMTEQLSGEHAMHTQMQMGPQKVPVGFFLVRDGVRLGL